ncbi:hypothetical protein BRAS3809_1570003 [Bradyrhizobium sp. STM 3809]|nr:hypothetical protein BRAS3809_1570003 [Bradyrhizobium sp. STM 3809]
MRQQTVCRRLDEPAIPGVHHVVMSTPFDDGSEPVADEAVVEATTDVADESVPPPRCP